MENVEDGVLNKQNENKTVDTLLIFKYPLHTFIFRFIIINYEAPNINSLKSTRALCQEANRRPLWSIPRCIIYANNLLRFIVYEIPFAL